MSTPEIDELYHQRALGAEQARDEGYEAWLDERTQAICDDAAKLAATLGEIIAEDADGEPFPAILARALVGVMKEDATQVTRADALGVRCALWAVIKTDLRGARTLAMYARVLEEAEPWAGWEERP